MPLQKSNKLCRQRAADGLKFAHAAKEVQRAARQFDEADKRRADEQHGYLKVTKARG